jgi:hypothetical protein
MHQKKFRGNSFFLGGGGRVFFPRLILFVSAKEFTSSQLVRFSASSLKQGCQMVCVFSNQKSQFGYILQGLGMENVVIFFEHLEHFTDIYGSLV